MSIYEYDEELHMRQTREEGWEDGRRTERIETILDFLSDLGNISKDLHKVIINQQDFNVLKHWVKLAAKANSIEEFQNQITNSTQN